MPVTLDIRPEVGSTNAELRTRLAGGDAIPEGYWLIADRQTAGKGRQGRKWLDGEGNFMGSTVVSLSPQDPPPPTLSFVTALAVYETVAAQIAEPARLQLKWPNDVLLSGTKFCGILLERERDHAVIGIGVNLTAAPRLDERETLSLAQTGAKIDRDLFARELATNFDNEVGRWRQYGVEPILNRWQAAAHRKGATLVVHDDHGNRITGAYAGLDPDGALRLRLDDGSTRVIHAGDVMLEAD